MMSPLCTQRWGHASLSAISAVCESVSECPIHLCPALSIVQAVKDETLTQCWTNVGPPSTTLSQHQPSIGWPSRVWCHAECGPASKTAGQHYPSFGSKHRAGTASMLVPPAVLTRAEWIMASTGDAGPTFNRHCVGVGLYTPPVSRPACYWTQHQQTRGIKPVLV